MEEKKHTESAQGTADSTVWHCDGIRMGHTISRFRDYVSFSASNASDVIRLHYGLRGDYSFSCKQLNKTFDLVGSHHNMMYSKGFDMEVRNKTLEMETFGVQFPKDLFIAFTQEADEPLKRFTENILAGNNVLLSENWGVVDLPVQQVIHQIIHCSYTGAVKKLFLLSKSIELLALSAASCSQEMGKKPVFIKSNSDREKIIAVKDLIHQRLDCPPSLTEIARTVGLNEYKLKRGFKELFNTTIFGYLAEQRLQLARQYLLDTRKTAAEIAADLGYSTPQHFNNAFKKKFGSTPDSVRNNP